jgi:type I restriction enzyme R subunit
MKICPHCTRNIHFEFAICQHLGCSTAGCMPKAMPPSTTARTRCSCPTCWPGWNPPSPKLAALTKTHGASLPKVLAERVRKCLNEQGTLEVLRRGVEMVGLKKPLALVQFKPALGINPTIQQHYAANRLRVVRQVHHSPNNAKDALDLVLFVNGIAVATAELKSDFTQSVATRWTSTASTATRAQGRLVEPLLGFPGGALVHFAVSQSEVMMTTRLAGPATRSCPSTAATRAVPAMRRIRLALPPPTCGKRSGHARAGWKSWPLPDRQAQRQEAAHQRHLSRAITSSTRPGKWSPTCSGQRPGQRYLIQHSAGSGKTNSIAWTAHFLADLHDADNQKLFDSVLVVSDRNVLDAQLQEAIFDFERTTGVVATITDEQWQQERPAVAGAEGWQEDHRLHHPDLPVRAEGGAGAGGHRGQALRGDCRRGAQLADRRGGSQAQAAAVGAGTGRIAGRRRNRHGNAAGAADGGQGQPGKGLTYIAFTATPKQKTLELFGRKDADGLPQAFHVYSMRQAIEEGFILDVLKNYTTYKLAFKLANDGQEYDETQVERKHRSAEGHHAVGAPASLQHRAEGAAPRCDSDA